MAEVRPVSLEAMAQCHMMEAGRISFPPRGGNIWKVTHQTVKCCVHKGVKDLGWG